MIRCMIIIPLKILFGAKDVSRVIAYHIQNPE